jgi:hypothetical protein
MLEENMHDQHLILVVFEYPLEISRLLVYPHSTGNLDAMVNTPYPLEFPIFSVAGWGVGGMAISWNYAI